jgi:hypothetical protein
MSRRHIMAGSLVALAFPLALAAANDRPPPPKPPQAAIDACASSSQGAACSVTFGDRTINGTCELVPQTTTLACRPDHPPGPPPEAVDACKSASEGASCSFSHGDHSISGTCAKGPDGNGPLACKPEGPPR